MKKVVLTRAPRMMGPRDRIHINPYKDVPLRLVIGQDIGFVKWMLDRKIIELNKDAEFMFNWHYKNRDDRRITSCEDENGSGLNVKL